MAFDRPSLQDLITRVEGDIKSGLGLITLLRRSFLKVIARVLAGLAHLLFGYLSFVEKQAFPDTAEDEYLERWAGIWGVERKPATFTEFTCSVTGTAGVSIPINRVYRRSDGKEYTTQAAIVLTGSGDEISLIASEEGKASAVEVSDAISILSPIAGLDSEAVVTSVEIIAEDLEDLEALRQRLIDRIQNPPSGGDANDYIQWALSIPGITRAWINPEGLGPGTVIVYVVSDEESPITPLPAKILEVSDYIETVRPVTANVSVVAPVLYPVDLSISIKPNTAEVQDAIEAELLDLILRDSAVKDSYKSPGVLHDGKILLSRIDEAISIALDEEDHLVTLVDGGAPADVVVPTGNLATLGTITWATLP